MDPAVTGQPPAAQGWRSPRSHKPPPPHTRFQRVLAAVSTHLVPHLLDLFWVSVQWNKQVRDSRGGSSVSILFSPLKHQEQLQVRIVTTVSDTTAPTCPTHLTSGHALTLTEDEPMTTPQCHCSGWKPVMQGARVVTDGQGPSISPAETQA